MITLKISEANAHKLHKTAPAEVKAILEDSCAKDFFNYKYDQIKSYEDACERLGIEPMDEAAMLKMGFRQDEIDRRKLETITFAINDEEYLDWNNAGQQKWYPYFNFNSSSRFAFYDTRYDCSIAYAGDASRLCFKDRERATYAGQTFTELYKSIIDNKPTE